MAIRYHTNPHSGVTHVTNPAKTPTMFKTPWNVATPKQISDQKENIGKRSNLTTPKAKKYVDSHKDLSDAWKKIKNDPDSAESKYWRPRMGGDLSKESFGKAHRGEDLHIQDGTYLGGYGKGVNPQDKARNLDGGYKAPPPKKNDDDDDDDDDSGRRDKSGGDVTRSDYGLADLQDRYSNLLDRIRNYNNPIQMPVGYGLASTHIVRPTLPDVDMKTSLLSNLASRQSPTGQKVVDPVSGTVYANPESARIAGVTNWVYWYKWLEGNPSSRSMFAGLTTPDGVTITA